MAGKTHIRVIGFLSGAIVCASALTYVGGRLAEDPVPVLDGAGPVVDAALKDPAKGVPSGGWATIRGKNLARLTRTWKEADFQADRAPTVFEGVSVTVGGKAAFIAALRRGADTGLENDEIDVVLPVLPEGQADVVVTTPGGTTGAVPMMVVSNQPSLFTHAAAEGRYARGESGDGAEIVGPMDLFGSDPLDRPVRPAIPMELLRLTANGCGALEKTVEEGVRTRERIGLAQPVSIKFGEQAAELVYAGTDPMTPGLCLIEVKVPMLGTGEHEVTGTLGDTALAGLRYVAVREVEYPMFEHGTQSKFRLTGAHHFARCVTCHAKSRFWGTPQACEACHLDRYRATESPDHEAAGFPLDCSQCHVTSRFKGARGGHTASSKFPLTGRHAEAGCAACHTNGEYKKLETACSGCHLDDYEATTSPNHSATGIGKDCSVCHTPAGWPGARTDHSQTQFPLTGKHSKAACSACHTSQIQGKPPVECVSCHRSNYEGAASPNHVAAGYPTGCDACHTTEAFKPAKVDHPRQRFPLTGKHAALQCAQCHIDGKLAALDAQCSGCHMEQYKTAVNPNHVALGFPQKCETCHTTAGFKGAAIKHDRFTLTGRHVQTACTACHRDNVYAGTSRTCAGCHLERYNTTTKPPHREQGFPTDCQLCHSTSQFTGALFQHANFFALEGKHAAVQCGQCHTNGVYKGTRRDCAGCHSAAYGSTTAPNHASEGLPTSCQNCHTPAGWRPATFAHTSFALTGKHTGVACAKCHVAGKYTGTSRECGVCHAGTYSATTNPNHTQLGYPTTCTNCHTTAGWRPATFAHTPFALTGKHMGVACAKCHVSGQYAGTSTECSSCHLTNYNTAANPNHAVQVYPKACQTCHTTAGWSPASFVHRFPIFTGKHQTKWSKCTDCHIQPADFRVFSCFQCHTKTKMDEEHRSIAGYGYDSAKCYQCHPAGRKP